MISVFRGLFEGLACWQLQGGGFSLWLSADFGPRVMGLSFEGSENLLAILPEGKIQVAGQGVYSLRGGHRLWVAPERPETTYLPDDLPPAVEEIEGGLAFTQEVDQRTGIQKSWQIRIDLEGPKVVLDHKLTNQGTAPFELAPWAVTMLRPGGVGLLPLQEEKEDPHGLWPNRRLVFWPYTDVGSAYLQITNRGLYVRAEMQEGALKIGAPNPAGWLAYRQKGLTFVKETQYQGGANYLDHGASHQIYCSPEVIELETLGPVVTLKPGDSAAHQEIWKVYPAGSCPAEIQNLLERPRRLPRRSKSLEISRNKLKRTSRISNPKVNYRLV